MRLPFRIEKLPPLAREPLRGSQSALLKLARTSAFLFTLFLPTIGAAASQILDSINIEKRVAGPEIHINFTSPIQYITHAPASRGSTLEVQLRLLNPAQQSVRTETLSWDPTSEVPLTEVSFESSTNTQGVLTVLFTHSVQFKVSAGTSARSIVITLPPTLDKGRSASAMPAPSQRKPDVARTDNIPKLSPPPAAGQQATKTLSESKIDLSYPYVINLMSSTRKLEASDLPDASAVGTYRLYVTQFTKDGKVWNRLRLGFFETRQAAETFLQDKLIKEFRTAWITKAPRPEREASAAHMVRSPERSRLAGAPPTTESTETVPPVVTRKGILPAISSDKLEQLNSEARKAMTAGDYRRAIQLYTLLLQLPDHKYRQEALELLGLARERNGQIAHAKAEYEEYLRLYPTGDGAARVRQRLSGMLTARAKPRTRAGTKPVETAKREWRGEVYGSLAQFFYRSESFSDLQGNVVNQSVLTSDIDLVAQARNEDFNVRNRFTGGLSRDFWAEDPPETRTSISSLYIDVREKKHKLGARVGRQSRSTGGVLGRFDGGLFSYQAWPRVGLNLVAGLPVDKTTDLDMKTNRYFYGVSADVGTFAEHWDGNIFFIRQIIDDIVDRQATGAEVRYTDPTKSGFALIDYDVSYNALNTALVAGNWILPTESTLNFSLDYRKSPTLLTRNALQGQTAKTIGQLLNFYTEDEVRSLAEDRTADSASVTVGGSHPINSILQVSGNFTASEVSGTPSSGGVDGTPSTGAEFFYSGQLIGSNLLTSGDIAIAGLSYSDASTSDTVALTFNTRYPVNRDFRVNPKFRTDYRHNDSDGSERLRMIPSVRLNYRYQPNIQLEFEAGSEWWRNFRETGQEDSFGYFLAIGYRWDFDYAP